MPPKINALRVAYFPETVLGLFDCSIREYRSF